MIRYFVMNKRCFHAHVIVTVMLLMLGFSTQTGTAEILDVPKAGSDRLKRIVPLSRFDDPFNGISFPTIYKSGFDLCTNKAGKPVIIFFGSSTCSICEWLGPIFDHAVMNYMEDGSIEAHHYDLLSGDDLLTEEIETEVPPIFLKLKEKGDPQDLVPYINFSCKYERVGLGFKEDRDAEAEGQAIIDIIDTLIRVLSESGKKN